MPQYIVLDKCINCDEEIGATGTRTFHGQQYGNKDKIVAYNILEYSWKHTSTNQGKCEGTERELYAAGNKRPPGS